MAKQFDLRKKNKNISQEVFKQGCDIKIDDRENENLLTPFCGIQKSFSVKKVKKDEGCRDEISFSQLSGLQEKLIEILYFSCRINGQKITQPISKKFLMKQLKTTRGTLKSIISRLIFKKLIAKHKSHSGRSGWVQYELSSTIYSELLQNERKMDARAFDEISFDKKTNNSIVEESQSISIPEVVKNIGFGEMQLRQLRNIEELSLDMIQESLNHFAFDLDNGMLMVKTNRLNFLMGTVRKGGYTSSKYVEEEELAIKMQLKVLQLRKESREKEKEQYEELLFEEWIITKTEEEIWKILPPPMNDKTFYMKKIHKELLLNYFVENEMDGAKKCRHQISVIES